MRANKSEDSDNVLENDQIHLEYSPDTSLLLLQTSLNPLAGTASSSLVNNSSKGTSNSINNNNNSTCCDEGNSSFLQLKNSVNLHHEVNNSSLFQGNNLPPQQQSVSLDGTSSQNELLYRFDNIPLNSNAVMDGVFGQSSILVNLLPGSMTSSGGHYEHANVPNNVLDFGYNPSQPTVQAPSQQVSYVPNSGVFTPYKSVNMSQQTYDDSLGIIPITNQPLLPMQYNLNVVPYQPNTVTSNLMQPRLTPDMSSSTTIYVSKSPAKLSEAEDWTPNPPRLLEILCELEKLNEIINKLKDECDLPNPKPNSKREKNRLASKACRLKKKATHESNKIKLEGLEYEFKMLVFALHSISVEFIQYVSSSSHTAVGTFSPRVTEIKEQYLSGIRVCGDSENFVRNVLERVKENDPTGGLTIQKKCMPKENLFMDQIQISLTPTSHHSHQGFLGNPTSAGPF